MAADKRVRNRLLTLGSLGVLVLILLGLDGSGNIKLNQVVALFAIWGIAAVSLNLINGVTGILSLGHHGFMLVGGYATALLILPQETRELLTSSSRSQMTELTLGLNLQDWFLALGLEALAAPELLWLRFIIALVIGGLVAAVFGLIVGIPSLRLRGDYLAIVTFAFGEAIRLLASTPLLAPFTNGALGFAGVPSQFGKSVWWTMAVLAITVFVMIRLKSSSHGRALQGIREDEVAAEAMGVKTSYHKVLAFALSAFFAGVAGGLWVSWVGTARLDLFLFTLTFYFLVAISVGGTGSITGALLGTALVVAIRQYGGFIEAPYQLATWFTVLSLLLLLAAVGAVVYRSLLRLRPRVHMWIHPLVFIGLVGLVVSQLGFGIGLLEATWQGFGMRAILLSVLLVAIMVFRPEGAMGRSEFSWGWLLRERKGEPSEDERAQDAWLGSTEPRRRDSESEEH